MKTQTKLAILVVFGVILGIAAVYALPQGAGNVQQTANETWGGESPAGVTAQGGYISNLTIQATMQTTKWQGFYGDVSGTITLADSSGSNYMYNWSVSPGTGVVIFTQNNAFPWSQLTNGSDANADNVWGFSGPDNAENTFSDTACSPVTVYGKTIGDNDNEVYLWDNTGSGYFCEYLGANSVGTSKADFAFIAKLYPSATCFNGDTCNFEAIVPVNPDGVTTETYYVYVEF